MASYSWILGSGDWNNPGKWTPTGGPPKSTDSAAIAATGASYTITVDTPDAANSLTLSSSSATLNDTASLTIGGALALSAGALNVNSAGVLTANGLLSLSGGSLNVNSGATAASLTQTGGTIGGTGKLTISGAATFSGSAFGTQTGTGTTLLKGVTTDSGFILLEGGRVLENAGTFNVSSSQIVAEGGTIKNDAGATFDFQSASTLFNDGGTNAFANAGTLEGTLPTGIANVEISVTNTGTIAAKTGTLELSGGGSSTGAITAASGATVNFGGGTFTLSGGSYSASGTTGVSGGTTNFTGAAIPNLGALDVTGGTIALGSSGATASSLKQTGGTVGGAGKLTVSGAATFSGGAFGTQTGTGTTLLKGVTTDSGFILLEGGRVLENAGTFNVSSSETVAEGGTIKNDAGATFDFQSASTLVNDGGTNAFANAGTLEGTLPTTGTANVEISVTNTGTIAAKTGTLELSGGGSSTGAITAASGATLDFGGGTFTLSGGSYSASGTTEISGGTTNFTGAAIPSLGSLDVTGGTIALGSSGATASSLKQTGGTVGGAGKLTVSGAATFSGSANEIQTGTGTTLLKGVTSDSGVIVLAGGRVLENAGTFNVSSSETVAEGGTIKNDAGATFDFQSASTLVNDGGTNAFANAGTLEGTLPTTGTANVEISVTNTGTIAAKTGTLELSGGGSSTGAITAASGATLDFGGGTFTLSGGSISGAGVLQLSGGTLATTTNILIGSSFAQTGGTISGSNELTISGAATFGGSSFGTQTGTGTTLLKGVTTDSGFILLEGGRVLENAGTFNVSSSEIVAEGGTIKNDAGATFDFQSASTLVNDGGTNAFANAGTLEGTLPTTGTANVEISVTNTGTIAAKTGTLELSGGGSSTGAITAASGATLDFGGGTFTLSGGSISGAGVLQLSGGTLATTTNILIGSSFAQTGGTISGSNELTISGAATFGGSSFGTQTGTGTTLLKGTTTDSGFILLEGGRVLENAGTFNVSSSETIAEGGTIKNDAGATFDFQSASTLVKDGGTNAFANAGTLEGTLPTGTADIEISVTNTGTIAAKTGMLELSGGMTNLTGSTLTGGAYSVSAGSVLVIENSAAIVNDNANISLIGAGSTIQSLVAGEQQSFDTTLRTIGTTGQLHLLAGRSLTTSGAPISDNGLIELGGGALTVTGAGSSLTIGTAGKLLGAGVINATTLANSGLIEASGGTLSLTNAVSGAGAAQIDAHADLVLSSTTATTNAVKFSGAGATLTLDHLSGLTGAISGFGLDDTIGLVGITANGASVNGSNQLVVTENGTIVATLQLSGDNSGFFFLSQPVSGGTDVISLPIPATVADYLADASLYDKIPGGFSIADTAVNVSTSLNQLSDSRINAIKISDNGAVKVSVAQLSSDATTIAKLADANGTPYQLAISDTAANVTAALATLPADVGHIASVTSTSGIVTVSEATWAADRTILDKVVGGFAISDSLPNVVSNLSALDGDTHVASIAATSGSATLASGVTIAAPAFSLAGSGTTLTVSENLSYTGKFSVGAGSVVSVSTGDKLTLSGTAALSGALAGAGVLATVA